MDMKQLQGKAGRFIPAVLAVVALIFAALAAMFSSQGSELEAALSEAQGNVAKAQQDAQAQRKKADEALKAAAAKIAALEQERAEAARLTILLASIEPQLAPVLEAASRVKTGKPEARAAGLVGLGLIGQIAHGMKHEAALATLERALQIDGANCAAGLGINLAGIRKVEVSAECAALLPATPAAPVAAPAAPTAAAAKEVNPAAEAKPGAEAKPPVAAAPATAAAPAAPAASAAAKN
ncbi:MAG: hypothetical protein IPH39_20840 [Sulfuritalea sp.]|nr:hypothetical protein [Sulfuritalea sp.]MBK9350540.1 hypothetical protein [Sulfuritalea sp.]